jgi:hypothetical protein
MATNPDDPNHAWYYDADDDVPMGAPVNVPSHPMQASGECLDYFMLVTLADVLPLKAIGKDGATEERPPRALTSQSGLSSRRPSVKLPKSVHLRHVDPEQVHVIQPTPLALL